MNASPATLTDERLQAALDRDLNVARIAAALERIADALEPEPAEEERKQDPGPDDAPASPEDAATWRPVKGGRAHLVLDRYGWPGPVVVDRFYKSESDGALMAVVVSERGEVFDTRTADLVRPRS